MFEMECIFESKDVYGEEKFYPVCETSQIIAKLSGNTTLTPKTIALAKQLGYTFKQPERKL
mgnify:CR=1 FL=1|jgi:hypothetical protein|tara:strand:+ start:183 stop:365 length:183 start_codon:yes stop_codon:yes gene_type:complete